MKNSKTLLALILTTALGCSAASTTSSAFINIFPSKDNTLDEYDPAQGDHSNGAGFHFFAGETAMSELRRGVFAFDIAGSIPPGSTITGVTLSLNCSRVFSDTARTIELHKLLADWVKEPRTHLERKVTEHRPPLTMPHGGTVSSTRFFGPCKAATFLPRLVQASRLAPSDNTRGVQRRWLQMCNHGWTIRPAPSAGWYWGTSQPTRPRNGSTPGRAQARLC